MADDSSPALVWSRYWKHGALHSLSDSFDGNYPPAIRAFWEGEFEPLHGGSRVLDIGTGNGPLPAMLAERGPGAMPEVDAVDLADVAPAWLDALDARRRSALRFHSNVAAEALPFPDASFDLVISQYGIEYADHRAALAEVARVLRPGGRCAFVLHHAAGRLAEVARAEEAHARWLIADEGPLASLVALLPFARQVADAGPSGVAGDPDATAARERYNHAMRALSARAASAAIPDLLHEVARWCATFVAATLRGERRQSVDEIERVRRSIADGRVRSDGLLRHALDERGLDVFAGLLGAHGVAITSREAIRVDGSLLAWCLSARRVA